MNPEPFPAANEPEPAAPAISPRPVDVLAEIYLAIGLPAGPAVASARADLVALFGCEQPAWQSA